MEIAAGDWDLAETLCDDGRASADQSGEVAMALLFRATRAELAAARGEDGVREELAALAPLAAAAGYHGAVHRLARAAGGYELSVGDPAAAYDAVSAYLGDPSGLDEALAQLVGSVVVEALAGTGRLTEAEHWLTLLDQRARDAHAGLRLLAARCRAALQRARGDPAAAVSTLAEAVDQPEHSRGVNALEHARTVLELGVALRSARHKRDARVTLERAAEAFGGLGALRWESLARSEVRRIGGRSPADGLFSETERLIVAQVLAGRRNREVAELLHLSPNTVAWNLSRIYRKVGVASRTELAARLGGEVPE
jgi:DNA-binding CsgD family transcriptional regulator